MRGSLGPLRAALVQGRRRGVLAILIAGIVIFPLLGWRTYSSTSSDRERLRAFRSGKVLVMDLFGCTCEAGECRILGPEGPIGPPFEQTSVQKAGYGACGGQEEEAKFEKAPPQLPAEVETQLHPYVEAFLVKQADVLSARWQLDNRTRLLGTAWGVIFALLLAATFFGAEFRWGVWRALLTHEPRRGRVLVSKFIALWVLVAIGFVAVLIVLSVLDVAFRAALDVHGSSGPSLVTLGADALRALLCLEVYATLAGAFAVAVRTSLAGLVGGLGFLIADGSFSNRFTWLRHLLPTQQVATLLSHGRQMVGETGYGWWQLLTTKATCAPNGSCTAPQPLAAIPQTRAVLVLLIWLVLAVAIATAALRSRDVPQ